MSALHMLHSTVARLLHRQRLLVGSSPSHIHPSLLPVPALLPPLYDFKNADSRKKQTNESLGNVEVHTLQKHVVSPLLMLVDVKIWTAEPLVTRHTRAPMWTFVVSGLASMPAKPAGVHERGRVPGCRCRKPVTSKDDTPVSRRT